MVRLPEKIQHSTDPGRPPPVLLEQNRFIRAVAFIITGQGTLAALTMVTLLEIETLQCTGPGSFSELVLILLSALSLLVSHNTRVLPGLNIFQRLVSSSVCFTNETLFNVSARSST